MLKEEIEMGASRPNDQIKGELLAIFADLKATHELEKQELAWLIMSALEMHLKRTEGLEEWVNFTAKLAETTSDTIAEIDRILHEDAKDHGRFH